MMHKLLATTLIILALAGCDKLSRGSTINAEIIHPIAEPIRPTKALAPSTQQQIRCLAHNIYFEARGEPEAGQIAVAMVTLNRVQSEAFPDTVCEVVKQQRKQTCQFSWWCDHNLKSKSINNKINHTELYKQIKQLATDLYLMKDHIPDITNGAIFYHATHVPKAALGRMKINQTTQIGKHIFYK